jgi:hypothetical protein
LFYAPLWYAYTEWKVGQQGEKMREDIELAENVEEGQIRLLERSSVDSLESLRGK